MVILCYTGFNIQILRAARTLYLCDFVWISEQTVFFSPCPQLTGFSNRGSVCLLRGTNWTFSYGLPSTQVFPCCVFRFGFHTERLHGSTTYLIHSIAAANRTLPERKSRELPKFLLDKALSNFANVKDGVL